MQHDFKAALKRFGSGENGPVLRYQVTGAHVDDEEIIRAALRQAIAAQDAEEAVERGEAVLERIGRRLIERHKDLTGDAPMAASIRARGDSNEQ